MLANRDKAIALYDDRFAPMWEFYLAACEAASRFSSASASIQFSLHIQKESDGTSSLAELRCTVGVTLVDWIFTLGNQPPGGSGFVSRFRQPHSQ